MDLSPAHWIWLPSQRTLANTFVLFRRAFVLPAAPRRAHGWIAADSRYRLTANGRRIQWGPAPCDPRQMEVDPLDLTAVLRPGANVIGAEVLFYGLGEGTWVSGKPGFICKIEIEHTDGQVEQIVSDETWQVYLDRAHRPGQYKRWFLRALQEEFDARRHPYGWDTPAFVPDQHWLPAMKLHGSADRPTSCIHYWEYLGSDTISPAEAVLRPRTIPMLREIEVSALRLAAAGRVVWLRDPADWFEFRVPGSFRIVPDHQACEPLVDATQQRHPAAPVRLILHPGEAAYLTFEFAEQIVGWPYFMIDAPEGTIVEVLAQESHDPAQTAWLDTHMFAWSRFICREGRNTFETFDFESLRWLQLHIRSAGSHVEADACPRQASRPIVVSHVGVRRRIYPWPHQPDIRCDEPALQRLFDAGINTLHNCAQETCVDGMGRERQQYSGDGGHQLHAIRYAFGETRLPARFLRTFSAGLTRDGYFLDCWPGYDRLARLMQRQIGATPWGPLLDHGVGFCFDCWHHYMQTGDLEALREPYPRLLRFAAYLEALRGADGLLPVEQIGVPAVWIDHEAYRRQRHKQCAFNLYAAAMFRHALAPICHAFGEHEQADRFVRLGQSLSAAAIDRFWSRAHGLFVNNLPWLEEEAAPRLCDRSLAMAILFDQCPGGDTQAALHALAACPPELGLSYPANACWRYWALAKLGRIDVVLNDLRTRWATMDSVMANNTIQEFWSARPDTPDQWSHCAVVPIYMLYSEIAGIKPAAPGFTRCEVRPQPGDLGRLALTACTVRGPIRFAAEAVDGGHRIMLALPPGCEGELLLPAGAVTDLQPLESVPSSGLQRFRLEGGRTILAEADFQRTEH